MVEPERLERILCSVLLGLIAVLGAVTAASARVAIPNYLPLTVYGSATALGAAIAAPSGPGRGVWCTVGAAVAAGSGALVLDRSFPYLIRFSGPAVVLTLSLTALAAGLGLLAVVLQSRIRWVAASLTMVMQWRLYAHHQTVSTVVTVAILSASALVFLLSQSQIRLVREHHRTETINSKLAVATARLMDMRQRQNLAVLSAGIAHEINNPVNYLMGDLSFLRRHFTTLYAESSPPSAAVEAAYRDGTSILDAFDHGLTAVHAVVTRLRGLFRGGEGAVHDNQAHLGEVVEAVKASTRGSETLRIVTVDTGAAGPVRFHPADLFVVLSNLVRNASEAGRQPVTVTIRLDPSENAGQCLSVEDDGPGVPEDLRQRVFDPFFTTKGDRGGVGVGLALCVALAEKNGAEVRLDESPTGGARITISIPKRES